MRAKKKFPRLILCMIREFVIIGKSWIPLSFWNTGYTTVVSNEILKGLSSCVWNKDKQLEMNFGYLACRIESSSHFENLRNCLILLEQTENFRMGMPFWEKTVALLHIQNVGKLQFWIWYCGSRTLFTPNIFTLYSPEWSLSSFVTPQQTLQCR